MSSVLDEIVDFSQFQRDSAPQDTPPSPSTPPMRQDSPPNGGESFSDSDDDNGEPGAQPLSGTHDPPDSIAAFTINAARNHRLTTDGERSLLQFSQVISFPPFLLITLTSLKQCVKLDTRSALIYQQATLIRLNEMYTRREPATTGVQRPETSNRLVLTDEIKVSGINLSC